MTAIISGSAPSVSFSDGTTQTTSAIVGGYVPYANMPVGSVLQVVNTIYTAYTTTTNTSMVATGITATITPKFATSKILIFVSLNGLMNSTSNNAQHWELYKNGISLTYIEDIYGYNGTMNAGSSYQYYDSPATTSATTYTMYWASTTGGNCQLNNYYGANNRTKSSITLMEIAQ